MSNIKNVKTYFATIWIGFKECDTSIIHTIDEVYDMCQQRCNQGGLCVTVTPTRFIYKDGYEDGCAIGFINYPRFPESRRSLLKKVIDLTKILKYTLHQKRATIVCKNRTFMLE